MATPRLRSEQLALGYICAKCRSWTQSLRAEPLLLLMPPKLLTMWPSSKGALRAKLTVLELVRRRVLWVSPRPQGSHAFLRGASPKRAGLQGPVRGGSVFSEPAAAAQPNAAAEPRAISALQKARGQNQPPQRAE